VSDDVPKPRSTTGASAAQHQRKQRKLNPIVELVGLVAIALLLALGIQAFLVKPYQIPSGSMEPTLDIGQRVLVNRLSHHLGSDPSVGDVVVFHPPRGADGGKSGLDVPGEESAGECADPDNLDEGRPCDRSVGGEWSDENYIKRVVGGPGDRISVRGGRVIRNGKPTKEPFIKGACDPEADNPSCTLPKTITVPAGMYYMMGDNRGASNDSRFWGPVPRDWVVGNAFATYWPPKKIGGV
jgi:signal peptidase I